MSSGEAVSPALHTRPARSAQHACVSDFGVLRHMQQKQRSAISDPAPGPALHVPLPTFPGTTALLGRILWEVNYGHRVAPRIVENKAVAWHRRSTSKRHKRAPTIQGRVSCVAAEGVGHSCLLPLPRAPAAPLAAGFWGGVTRVTLSRCTLSPVHTTGCLGLELSL